jgi:cytoskeletal protein CcmA (bactofilin family)
MFNAPKIKDLDNAKMETIIGPDSAFQGSIKSKGYVRVDGKVEGGISAEGVIVGEGGQVQGDVTAKTVVVAGKVTGNVIAATALELQTKGQIVGDIRASQISIAEGAVFEGNCVMAADKTKVIDIDQVLNSPATKTGSK